MHNIIIIQLAVRTTHHVLHEHEEGQGEGNNEEEEDGQEREERL